MTSSSVGVDQTGPRDATAPPEQQRSASDLEHELQAQSALVTAQELALRGYADDLNRLRGVEDRLRAIEGTLTWRVHSAVARFRIVRLLARLARRSATKLRR